MTLERQSASVRLDVTTGDDRYHRQSLISWWDQDRLREARVLVAGAGALGNELVKNLVLLGVGTIVLADLDQVENSNLSRCVFFREEDEGADKASVVAERAGAVNPDVHIIPVVGDIRLRLGLGVFDEVDVVLGGLDNREARLHLNQACWKTGTPFVDGAIEGLLGVVRVFEPPDSSCYECTMSSRDHELIAARRACSLLTREQMLGGKVPTTATSASVIAAMQAQEAVKLLHRDRIAQDFSGKGYVFNGLTHDSYVVEYPRRDDCLSHDAYALEGAVRLPAGATLGEVLAQARHEIGPDVVLEAEHEVVEAMECRACDAREVIARPLHALRVGAARCPTCGEGRALVLTHQFDERHPDLLSLTPAEIGLPPYDVLTARRGTERSHFVVGEGSAVRALELEAQLR
jgi:molybdopterin/thiamine biosynthesis adenylyltransferase